MNWMFALFLLIAQGPPTNPQWSSEEVKQKIKEVFAPESQPHVDVFRSAHFIVFTEGAPGKTFAEVIDREAYDRFRAVFPFSEPKEARLIPIFLFRSDDSLLSFAERIYGAWGKKCVELSSTFTGLDFYAAVYGSPREITHYHEIAHVILSERLKLAGGGSWFREGIAEYFKDQVARVNIVAETKALIKEKSYLPFRQFFAAENLLLVRSQTHLRLYGQAASLIHFLKEGPWKTKWNDFFSKVGSLKSSRLEEVEKALREIYGLSIEQIEEKWKDYFLK